MAADEAKVDSDLLMRMGRSSFPPGFLFGAGSSAYQVEGAHDKGGKKPSIWDNFCHTHPEKIEDHSNGDVALDSYNRFNEDVKVLKDMGADVYKFSISWPRILPDGRGTPNQEGITYYNNLINELIANGIKPFVTLFHWDVPQALEDEYEGFLCRRIVEDFKLYTDICFKEFGDRVKYWITLNEPSVFCMFGYTTGRHAPGRCSNKKECAVGDSATEPYMVTHNMLLAHAAAVQLYRQEYRHIQRGEIGIVLQIFWITPYSSQLTDVQASKRCLDFSYGWHMEPLVYGDYPIIMRALVRERLPYFTPEEQKMLKGSYDFIGINYYSARYAQDDPTPPDTKSTSYLDDRHANLLVDKDGIPIGESTGTWQYIYPQGIYDLLMYTKENYQNPKIYITENGLAEPSNIPVEKARKDYKRAKFHIEHLEQILRAMRQGVNVQGYIIWCIIDNFEWNSGYTIRFGLCSVDSQLNRNPKFSHEWFSNFLRL